MTGGETIRELMALYPTYGPFRMARIVGITPQQARYRMKFANRIAPLPRKETAAPDLPRLLECHFRCASCGAECATGPARGPELCSWCWGERIKAVLDERRRAA